MLNGAEGMNGMLSQVMGAGVASVSMFKDLFDRDNDGAGEAGDGVAPLDAAKERQKRG